MNPEIDGKPVVILGSGPGGLAAALCLLQNGIKPVIFERSSQVGGLMQSVVEDGFRVDLGRKELYSRIPEVNKFWSDILGKDYVRYDHRVGILYKGHIYESSAQYKGITRGMSLPLFAACFADKIYSRIAFYKPTNYAQYRYRSAGKKITEIFSQGFQERFNGEDWRMLSIPMQTPTSGVASQTEWRHPRLGSGQIVETLAASIRKLNGEIETDVQLTGVITKDNIITGVITNKNGNSSHIEVSSLISAIQPETLGRMLFNDRSNNPVSSSQGVLLVYLFIDESPRFPHAWLNVSCPRLKIGRITNYAMFGGDMVPPGKCCLCIEYFLRSDDELFLYPEEKLYSFTLDQCNHLNLFEPSKIIRYRVFNFPQVNAAASWSDNIKNKNQNALLKKLSAYDNLYNIARAGTDRATHAGLIAAESLMNKNKERFELLTDPCTPEPWLTIKHQNQPN